MTDAGELVARLRRSEISVWADGEQLRLRAAQGALTAELTDELKRRKAELLAYLRDEHALRAGDEEVVARAGQPGSGPLSFAQQRLWFLQQLEPGASTYNMPFGVLLDGPLDAGALRRAVDDIWRRHDVLRTRFSNVDGCATPVVTPYGECAVVERSLEGFSAPEHEVRRAATAEASRPFDLENAAPLRVELLRLGAARHALLVTAHHIAFDAWSTGIFSRELSLLYAAHRSGQPSPLPDLTIQYADYAAWQQRRLASAALEPQLRYWREQLRGVPALDFPTDRPRPSVATSRGSAFFFELDPPLAADLERLGRETSATSFMVLLAAFAVLLQRYSGQADFAVGTPIAGRTRAELEPLIGCFVNTLALRLRPGESATGRDWIAAVRRTCLDAYANQDVPFEQLVEKLQPERDLGRNPLFQIMFILENAPGGELELPDLRSQWLAPEWTTARLDLTLSMQVEGGAIRGAVEYNADLFDAATIGRFAEHFGTVLGALVRSPDSPLVRLPLWSATQDAAQLSEHQRTRRPYRSSSTFLDAFAAQVDARPQAIALESGEQRLSYRELSERANRLAGYLRARGVRAGDRVAFCVERSAEMLVGLLGVLQAGAAYVPLDPAYPERRLAFMLRDCRPSLVLTEERWLSRLDCGDVRVVLIDGERDAILAQPDTRPPRALADASAAYVIYTSGSTGQPKGVEVPHRALLNLLLSMRAEPGLRPEDGLLAITTVCFDIAGLELFLPLLVGARVVLLPAEVTRDPARLSRAIVASQATVLQATPATFQMLVTAGFSAGSLRLLLCGGEALSSSLAETLLSHGVELWNVYGPTETTIWSSAQRVGAGKRRTDAAPDVAAEGAGPHTVPIGRAIDNTRIHIVDRNGERAPLGAIGELCIAGDGVANGYFGRPALTAERFIPEPEGPLPGARMYRTGDRARWRSDGQLEFLGRIDHQVKLRGHRIELGEVEAVLAKHPALRQCAVALCELGPMDVRLIAYVVPANGALAPDELRSWARERLPEVMVPSMFCEVAALALTPNGKVDRRALPAPEGKGITSGPASNPARGGLEHRLVRIWSELLRREDVGAEQNFFDLGGHSLLLVQLHARLQHELDPRLTLMDLFRFPTIRSLAEHLGREQATSPASVAAVAPALAVDEPIAIVGMSGRFPRARNLAEYWRNLREGTDCIQFFSDEELGAAGVPAARRRDPRYVPARGVLEDVECFDAAFFGISPGEARLMDPQQRILLEVGWEALEDAGYASPPLPFAAGVFASASQNVYASANLGTAPEGVGADASYLAMIGNEKDYLATRLSYVFDLQGPSLSVQTACSSSLVAVHLACASLRRGECDLALAGGVCVQERVGYLYEEGMVSSPDGHCRAFDERARGTVWGSGAGMVVLRRLSDAIRDGDTVHAVIRGSAVNNDGARKVGYMAPSVHGQAAVISRARAAAGVDARSVGYVEAHGTGTPLGDPIEVAALRQVTPNAAADSAWCALGSVKTNIGHLDAAAGIAGLLKTVLVLRHGEIPPTLHFERPNPQLELGSSAFYVNSELRPWPSDAAPRRAGVSSFGIGGTNAHVVLEQAPAAPPRAERGGCQLLMLSARSGPGLDLLARDLAEHLRQHPDIDLADVAFTLQVGRRRHSHRRSVVAADVEEAVRALDAQEPVPGAGAAVSERPVAFLFPGQGAQYVGMGQELYRTEARFREVVDRCAEIVRPHLGLDLRTLLYPEVFPPLELDAQNGGNVQGDGAPARSALGEAAGRLDQTRYTQPALFTVAYATAQLWMSWGVVPEYMLGHSIGEYVAATLAGVFELEDALALVAVRGALLQSLPVGAMLAVPMDATEVVPMLGAELSLAARNGPAQCVVSGPCAAIEQLEARLATRGVEGRRLATSHAFHSAMLDPVLATFSERLRAVRLSAPQIPFASNVTGDWMRAEEATSPAYWARQLRETVDFAGALSTLSAVRDVLFLEVGPGRTLGAFARRLPLERQPALIAASLPGASDPRRASSELSSETRFIKSSLGRLWGAGAKLVRSAGPGEGRGRRIPLPPYPFERQRHWIDMPTPGERDERAPATRADVRDWFYLPSFKPALALPPLVPGDLGERRRFWLFGDESSLSRELEAFLQRGGQDVVTVVVGEAFARLDARRFALRPASLDDHVRLVEALAETPPDRILHLWSRPPASDADHSARGAPSSAFERGVARFEACQARGFYSLVALCRALSGAVRIGDCPISVVSEQLFEPHGGSELWAEQAPLVGLGPVIPQEYPHLGLQVIDVGSPASSEAAALAGVVLAEIVRDVPAPRVALRDGDRWLPALEAIRLGDDAPAVRAFRPGGTYLITGGLGRIGLALARHLARVAQARLILITRSPFPARDDWPRWLEEHPPEDETSRRIHALGSFEALGAEVLVLVADVADATAMREAIARAEARFGPLHGVVHAAGARSDGSFVTPLSQADRAACEAHFRPKVRGTQVLHELLGARALDFCVLMSSTSALLGGLGLGPYAAANQFMDAFVQVHRREHRGAWMVLDWDAWSFEEPGLAPNGGRGGPGGEALPQGPLDLAMTAEQGVEAFDRAVRRGGVRRLVVATGALEPRLARWVQAKGRERTADTATQRRVHPRPALSVAFEAPRTELERGVAAIFAAVLGFEAVGIFDDLFELGGDSLSAIQIVARIHTELGQHLSPALLLQTPTAAELAARLEQPEAAPRSPAVPIQPRGSASPLFWVPGTGGNVLYFQPLASQLEDTGHPFYALEPIGVDGREPPRPSVPEIARSYIPALRAIQPHGPYFIAGHSFGSWVAYELAQQLMDLGEPIARLAVLDTVAPAQRDLSVYRGFTGADWILTLASIVAGLRGKPLALSRAELIGRSWEQQLDALCDALRAAGVMPAGATRRHIRGLVDVYRTQAQMEYRRPPGRPVSVALFRASELNPESEEVPAAVRSDPSWGWQAYACGDVVVEDVPGDHLTMMTHPHVQALARRVRLYLPPR